MKIDYRFTGFGLLACFVLPVLHAQPMLIGGGGMNAVQALQQAQHRADDAYNNKEYKVAYRRYLKLAEIGDKFAQFRLAVMHEDGHHVEQNVLEAYAWSYLAAENQRREFVDYHQSIKARLSSVSLDAARQRASALIADYGLYRQAIEAEELLTKTLRTCTGSRVGNTCDAVEVEDLTCNIQSDRIPSPGCLRIGSMGLPAIVGSFPLQIRYVRQNLREFIDRYNPGRVELGDFELIDNTESQLRKTKAMSGFRNRNVIQAGAVLFIILQLGTAYAQIGGMTGTVNTNAVQALTLTAQRADQAYTDKHYSRAFKLYRQLATIAGDQFSQYRLAVMFHFGHQVAQDEISAYAWSYLAAESGVNPFVQFNRQISARLTQEQKQSAAQMASRLIKKYGIFQQAYKTRKLLRKEKFSCTGSRVGNTCSSVATTTFQCSAAADQAPSEQCLRIGRIGLNSVAGSFPLRLKQAEEMLDELMDQYNPGRVELKDLELLDDYSQSTNDD